MRSEYKVLFLRSSLTFCSDKLKEVLLNQRIHVLQRKKQYLEKLKLELGKKQEEKARLGVEQEEVLARVERLRSDVQSLPALLSA